MRIRHLATIACCVALLSATSLSVRGQQDPLPPVTPKNGVPAPPSEIILTSGPVAVYAPATLGAAAANNDYLSFAALYGAMKTRGERVDAYTPLHDLWTWSLSDPIGAFYGREMYEQFASAYPAFASYIADHAIVDDAGNKYWPTSETRAFLLDRALAGESAKILVAEAAPRREARTVVIESEPATPAPKVVAASPRRTRPRTRAAKNGHRRADVSSAPAARPAPPQSKPAPVQVAQAQTPPQTQTPTPAPMQAAVETTAAGERDARPPVAEPVATPAPVTEAPIVPAPQTAATTKPWTNGIYMLLLLGILGVGLFAILMRSPKEEEITSISKVIEKPPATVEPITKFTPAGGIRGNETPGSDEPRQQSPRGRR